MKLHLYNTSGRQTEEFVPAEPGIARIYHCGPTVKEPIHIGKFRSYLLGDVLRRALEYGSAEGGGLEVRQVMNITDVGHLNEFEEDIVEIAAARSGLYAWELAEKEEQIFHEDRRALNILDAHEYPKARENIDAMVELIEALEKAGAAYKSGGNVYLDISRVQDFGKLAGESIDQLVERQKSSQTPASPNKKHPLDIDLWRTDAVHQMVWDSPWGKGFPGWHVECAAMSRRYLGGAFDVHTGSHDNLYPHHECEIAQVETLTGTPLARYWLHSGPVTVDGKEMSRAADNIVTVHELIDSGFRGSVIRLSLLSKHYREALDFGDDALDWAREAVNLILGFREHLNSCEPAPRLVGQPPAWIAKADSAFEKAISSDLDIATAVNTIADTLQNLHSEDIGDPRAGLDALEKWNGMLGVF